MSLRAKRLSKIIGAIILLAALITFQNGWGMGEMKNQPEKAYQEGEILVKFKKDISPERIRGILEETGTEKIKMLGTLGVYVLRLPQGKTVESMIEKFQTLPEVEYAEPNYTVSIRHK